MKVLAIIPARGGSKGVPGKNKAIINGKPLINYTIEVAVAADVLDHIVVSTDDPDILELAKAFEGVTLHQRDNSLAEDTSPIADTIRVLAEKYPADAIMLLQPTSPIRTVDQIQQAIALLERNELANSVISVTAMSDTHPARMYWKNNGFLNSILPEFEEYRRQDIPSAYYRNGAVYLVRTQAFLNTSKVMVKPSIGLEMPSAQLLNIDEPKDLLIAEVILKAWEEGKLK
ncbi:MAG: acylneuraminate cytidylyltransferase family protein [Bacteroidetes bacterium]|nr:acylneuraminate cytidylyltransferase family protein [Bacteroidota bacterium]